MQINNRFDLRLYKPVDINGVMNNPTLTQAVRGEIRAEVARKGMGREVLEVAWRITQPAVSSRLSLMSTYEFTTDDIERAANVLGFDTYDFIERAYRNAVQAVA